MASGFLLSGLIRIFFTVTSIFFAFLCVLILAQQTLLLMPAGDSRAHTLFSYPPPPFLSVRPSWHSPAFKMTFPFSLPILESFCSTSSDRDLGLSKMNVV